VIAVARDSSTTWRKASAGDAEAFRDLVEEHDERLVRACTALSGNRDVAEEAVQSAWIIAWAKLGTVREESRLAGWLTVVAVNETRKLIRQRRRRSLREGLGNVIGRVTGVRSPEELDLGAALQQLSTRDQAILLLRFVEDRTSDEVGALLGIPAATVRTRTRRALQRLRMELENDG